MIYFTSDLHIFHPNIIKFCKRPFNDVHSMNKHIINSWNKVVKPEDEIYILGDFSFGSKKHVFYYINQLNGIKYFIKGNHDRRNILDSLLRNKKIVWWKNNYEFDYEFNDKIYHFCLSHYPHYPIDNSNTVCLHGHVHGIFEHRGTYLHQPGVIDVGVDNIGYEPISIDTIIEYVERTINK